MISNRDRRVVDIDRKEVNMSMKRCTDMKSNRRVIFLAGRPPKRRVSLM